MAIDLNGLVRQALHQAVDQMFDGGVKLDGQINLGGAQEPAAPAGLDLNSVIGLAEQVQGSGKVDSGSGLGSLLSQIIKLKGGGF